MILSGADLVLGATGQSCLCVRSCRPDSEGGSAANRQATLNLIRDVLVVKRRHTEVMKPGGQPVLNPNDSDTAAWSVNFKEGRFSFLSSIVSGGAEGDRVGWMDHFPAGDQSGNPVCDQMLMLL